jgi:hypothetical protein
MITRSYITSSFKFLDRKYRKATTSKELFFYSKLAIFELCGWIEESMDDIILRCARLFQVLTEAYPEFLK